MAFDSLGDDQIAELITLKLRALPTTISASAWARTLRGFSPAEIELVCFDAMRRAIRSGHVTVDNAVMVVASGRMRTRKAVATGVPSQDLQSREKT